MSRMGDLLISLSETMDTINDKFASIKGFDVKVSTEYDDDFDLIREIVVRCKNHTVKFTANDDGTVTVKTPTSVSNYDPNDRQLINKVDRIITSLMITKE